VVQANGNGAETKRTVNVEMRRHAKRSLDENVMMAHAVELQSVINRPGSKWTLELATSVDGTTDWYRQVGGERGGERDYILFFHLRGENTKDADIQVADHLAALTKKGSQFKPEQRWIITRVDGADYIPMTPAERMERQEARRSDMVGYADVSLPTDWRPYFKDMVGVDAQLRMVMARVQNAIKWDFSMRFHGLLIGPPGCGKSSTLEFLRMMFSDDAVLRFDGTAMTSAGVAKTIEKLDVMPRFIIVEEIEKAPNEAVAVLLGMMDSHGEIRKNTYKDQIQRDCRVVVLATANNWEKLQSMQSGALASRFGAPIVFHRPTDEMLRIIIMQNLETVGLDKHKHASKWIERTLEWCHRPDVNNLDPRYVISVCLNGQDDLLNGKYQADLEATMFRPEMVVDFEN